MANELKVKITADTKDAEAGLNRTAENLGKVGTAAKTSGSSATKFASDFKGELADLVVQGTLAATAIGAVTKAVSTMISEASEAEQVSVRLAAALKNSGASSAAAVDGLDAWATTMQRTRGVEDDLAKSQLARGITMGASIEQSQRLVEVSADLATITGDQESAFVMLTRAMDGDVAALGRFGFQLTEAEKSGKDFESVLRKIEAATSGQAQASMDTFAGQTKALAGEFKNLAEEVGGPVIRTMTDWLRMINQAITDMGALGRAMNAAVEGQKYMDLARNMASVNAEVENLQKLLNGMGAPGEDWASTEIQRYFELTEQLDAAKKKQSEYLAEMQKTTAEAKKTGKSVQEAAGGGAATFKKGTTDAEKKAAEEAAKKEQDLQDKLFQQRLENLRIETQETAERLKMEWDAEKKLAEQKMVWDRQRADDAYSLAKNTFDQEQLLLQQYALSPSPGYTVGGQSFYSMASEPLGPTAEEAQKTIRDAELVQIENANLEIDLARERRQKQQEAHDAQMQAYEEQVRASQEFAMQSANIITSLISTGDWSTAISQYGSALTQYTGNAAYGQYATAASNVLGAQTSEGTAGAATGGVVGGVVGSYVPVIGTAVGAVVGSTIGGAIGDALGAGAQSVGGQLRESLDSILSDAGLEFTTAYSDMTAELQSTGQADFWQKMAEAIVGDTTGAFGGGGEMLYSAFADLGMTVGDMTDQFGNLIASTQNLTGAEGDLIAAQTALLSNAAFTSDELRDLAYLYGQSASLLEEKDRLEQQILEDAQAVYAAQGTSGESSALAALEADRAAYIGLMAQEAAASQQSDAELAAALEAQGMTPAQAAQMVDEQKTSTEQGAEMIGLLTSINQQLGGVPPEHDGQYPAYHSGRYNPRGEHIAWVRNDELIVPPEQFKAGADYLASRGFYSEPTGGSGGATTYQISFPNYLGSREEIAATMSKEIDSLKRRRKVA